MFDELVALRMPRAMRRGILAEAKARKATFSGVIRLALDRHLKTTRRRERSSQSNSEK